MLNIEIKESVRGPLPLQMHSPTGPKKPFWGEIWPSDSVSPLGGSL